MSKEIMEMMNQHLCGAKNLKKIEEKKNTEFYEEMRGSSRYNDDENARDEVEAELV